GEGGELLGRDATAAGLDLGDGRPVQAHHLRRLALRQPGLLAGGTKPRRDGLLFGLHGVHDDLSLAETGLTGYRTISKIIVPVVRRIVNPIFRSMTPSERTPDPQRTPQTKAKQCRLRLRTEQHARR